MLMRMQSGAPPRIHTRQHRPCPPRSSYPTMYIPPSMPLPPHAPSHRTAQIQSRRSISWPLSCCSPGGRTELWLSSFFKMVAIGEANHRHQMPVSLSRASCCSPGGQSSPRSLRPIKLSRCAVVSVPSPTRSARFVDAACMHRARTRHVRGVSTSEGGGFRGHSVDQAWHVLWWGCSPTARMPCPCCSRSGWRRCRGAIASHRILC